MIYLNAKVQKKREMRIEKRYFFVILQTKKNLSMSRLKTILSKIYHIRALKYIVVVVIGIAVVGFVDENSIWHHFTNKQRISELQDEIDMYNAQYQNDQDQIRKLDSDPKAIKKIARERYFMKADDEDIFVLSDDNRSGKSILDDETIE